MKEYFSFVSERTIEYVLIPALTKILSQHYASVIPIFPWMTREGTNMSRKIHQNHEFRVIGLYPRRPKIDKKSKLALHIKVKDEFIKGADVGSKINIPMIVGCPLIRSLWDLDTEPECVWLRVDEKTNINNELKFDEKKRCYDLKSIKNKFENSNDLLDFIADKSILYSFDGAINAFKTIKAAGKYSFTLFNPTPKPIYFLLGKAKPLAF